MQCLMKLGVKAGTAYLAVKMTAILIGSKRSAVFSQCTFSACSFIGCEDGASTSIFGGGPSKVTEMNLGPRESVRVRSPLAGYCA